MGELILINLNDLPKDTFLGPYFDAKWRGNSRVYARLQVGMNQYYLPLNETGTHIRLEGEDLSQNRDWVLRWLREMHILHQHW